jgi:cyclopropane fatty-acyl-phospholipid synthase-like methyltransferase
MSNSLYTTGEYVRLNPGYHTEDSSWKAEKILAILKKNQLQPKVITEIGCGAGEILLQLQLQLPGETQFYGYDISPQAVEMCKQRENAHLHCFCEDLITRDPPQSDLLLSIDVFEHVADYIGFVRALRPKATYKLFHIPLDISAFSVLRGNQIMIGRERLGHLHYFMKDTALATLKDTGYEIVDWAYTFSGIEKAERSFKQSLAKYPRLLLTKIDADLAVRILGGSSMMVLTR